LFIERDGSTFLTSLLTAHPGIHAVYERFAVIKQKEARVDAQLSWAEQFLTPPLIGRWGALGFKTKLVDVLDESRFASLLQEKECRIIQMTRRNHVKAVISRINARRLYEASGSWNLYEEKDRMPPMSIDLDELDRLLEERSQAEAKLEKYVQNLRLPTKKIVYENLLVDREDTIGDVLNFLNVGVRPLEARTLKHTSDDLQDVISNFEELRDQFMGTRYQAMLEERLLTSS